MGTQRDLLTEVGSMRGHKNWASRIHLHLVAGVFNRRLTPARLGTNFRLLRDRGRARQGPLSPAGTEVHWIDPSLEM
jgi:hypothetical protein